MSRGARLFLSLFAPQAYAEPPPVDPPDIGEPRSLSRTFISGHSLLDEPHGHYLDAIVPSQGAYTFEWERQNILGSPLRVRTAGSSQSDADLISGAYSAWTGYRDGTNKAGDDLDIIAELRGPAEVSAPYTDLVIGENHNSIEQSIYENTVRFLLHYEAEFATGNSAGQTHLFTTWKDYVGIGSSAADPTVWIAHERAQMAYWEAMVSAANERLATLGISRRISTLPASGALAELVEQATTGTVAGITGASVSATMATLFSDDVHLTDVGKYFIACVTFASVYRRTPVGAAYVSGGYNTVTSTQAASLQTIAWE
jgi:hypothetical protein